MDLITALLAVIHFWHRFRWASSFISTRSPKQQHADPMLRGMSSCKQSSKFIHECSRRLLPLASQMTSMLESAMARRLGSDTTQARALTPAAFTPASPLRPVAAYQGSSNAAKGCPEKASHTTTLPSASPEASLHQSCTCS